MSGVGIKEPGPQLPVERLSVEERLQLENYSLKLQAFQLQSQLLQHELVRIGREAETNKNELIKLRDQLIEKYKNPPTPTSSEG